MPRLFHANGRVVLNGRGLDLRTIQFRSWYRTLHASMTTHAESHVDTTRTFALR